VSVRIRLARGGRKKIPHYRIVVMDSRNRRDGAYLEKIGIYDPRKQPAQIEVAEDRVMHWLRKGAIPSDTVRSLLSRQGIMLKHDLGKRNTSPERVEEALSKWKTGADSREARRSEKRGSKQKPKEIPAEPTPDEQAQGT